MKAFFLQVLTRTVARTCGDGCKYLRERMQCTARTDAVHCGGGCSALRLRWVKLALKSSSPILDRRKGRKDSLHMGHCSPQEISAEPKIFKTRIPWSYDHSTLWSYVHTSLVGRP